MSTISGYQPKMYFYGASLSPSRATIHSVPSTQICSSVYAAMTIVPCVFDQAFGFISTFWQDTAKGKDASLNSFSIISKEGYSGPLILLYFGLMGFCQEASLTPSPWRASAVNPGLKPVAAIKVEEFKSSENFIGREKADSKRIDEKHQPSSKFQSVPKEVFERVKLH